MVKFLISLLMIFISGQAMAGQDGYAAILGEHKYVLQSSSGGSTDSQFAPLLGLGYFTSFWEIDGLYTQKVLHSGATPNTSIQIPVFGRAELAPWLTVGLGAFADIALTSPSNPAAKNLDYGPAISLQASAGSVFFDVRYLYGLVDIPGYSRDLNLLIGIHLK